MTNYREILRLHSQGISQRSIAASCACSRNTVAKVLNRAQELDVAWPLQEGSLTLNCANCFRQKPEFRL